MLNRARRNGRNAGCSSPDLMPRETVSIRLSEHQRDQIERMRREGGYRTRAQLLQSLIAAILADDAKAHEEKPSC